MAIVSDRPSSPLPLSPSSSSLLRPPPSATRDDGECDGAFFSPDEADDDSDDDTSAVLPRGWFSWRNALTFAGPGALMSIAFLDPGNLESCLQAASRARFSLLWLLGLATGAGWLIQLLAVKLGAVTGRDLAESCRLEYARPARLALWLAAEVAIVGADVQEVVGSALALTLLSKGALSLPAAIVASAASSFALLYVERLGVRHLEALFALFIGTMGASFAALAAVSGANPAEVARGVFVPKLPRGELATAVAVIGAVVMPHNLYLHSALVRAPSTSSPPPPPPSRSPPPVGGAGGAGEAALEAARESAREYESIPEEAMLRSAAAAAAAAAAPAGSSEETPRGGGSAGSRRVSTATDATAAARAAAPRAEAVAYFALESAFALSVALAINMCLVVAVAAGLDDEVGGGGLAGPAPAYPKKTLGLADAGEFLASKYGPAAAVVWGVGLLAAGQSSTMCGAYAGQHVMAGLLRLRAPAWARVAGARALAVAPTLLLATTMKDAPGAALDAAAQALNVVQAVQLPFALIPLIRLTASKRVMGGAHVAGSALVAAASAAAAAVLACNAGVALQLWAAAAARGPPAVAAACCFAGCYVGLAGYLAFGPAANGGVGAARNGSGRRRRRGGRGGGGIGGGGNAEALLL